MPLSMMARYSSGLAALTTASKTTSTRKKISSLRYGRTYVRMRRAVPLAILASLTDWSRRSERAAVKALGPIMPAPGSRAGSAGGLRSVRPGALRFVRPGGLGPVRAGAALVFRLVEQGEELQQLFLLRLREAPEQHLSAGAPKLVHARHQRESVRREVDEDRPAVGGVGPPLHQAERLEGVDHRGRRARCHLEARRQVAHAHGLFAARKDAQHAGLGEGEAERRKLLDGGAPQAPRGTRERLAQRGGQTRGVTVCRLGSGV